MTPIRLVLGAGFVLAALATAAVPTVATSATPAATAAAPAEPPDVDPDAVKALTRMSAYLTTLTAFEVLADTSQDLVMDDGQIIKLDGTNRYTVRRPDSFIVEVATSRKARVIYYNGKSLTLDAPRMGYYATVDAPPTIRQAITMINDDYGVTLPLQDLFTWADPGAADNAPLESAIVVGPASVDGVECDQYAFREGDLDWQIWIQKGDQPLPRKVVIIDRTDLSHPQYEVKLHWNLAPLITSDSFTYRPSAAAMKIKMPSARR
jgi:hypothetical protein